MTLLILAFAILVAMAAGVWALFRSISRWQLPAPSSEEAKQAVARLWSTRSGDQR